MRCICFKERFSSYIKLSRHFLNAATHGVEPKLVFAGIGALMMDFQVVREERARSHPHTHMESCSYILKVSSAPHADCGF